MDSRKARLNKIIDILSTHNGETIRKLATELEVSEMTIRRDLHYLSQAKIIKIIGGAAIISPNFSFNKNDKEYQLAAAEDRMRAEKERIGKKAATLIAPEDVIIIDTGTTTEYLARFLPNEFPLTVVCYTMNVFLEVRRKRNCKLIFPGGYFHENTVMFQSAEGVELIKKIRANKAFISAAGVSSRLGITSSNYYETDTKKAVIESSLTKILLVDSSKFGKIKPAYFAEPGDFNIVITDTGIEDRQVKIFEELGIEVIIV